MKTVMQNKFVNDIAMSFFSETVCPILAINKTVCKGGTDVMITPLFDAISQAFLDPEYFCENTVVLCHDGDYDLFHAEEYVNKLLESKPAIIKENRFLNDLYESIDELTIKNRKNLTVVHVSDPHVDFMYAAGSDS